MIRQFPYHSLLLTRLYIFDSYLFPFILGKPPIFDNILTFSNDYSHYFGEVTN